MNTEQFSYGMDPYPIPSSLTLFSASVLSFHHSHHHEHPAH